MYCSFKQGDIGWCAQTEEFFLIFCAHGFLKAKDFIEEEHSFVNSFDELDSVAITWKRLTYDGDRSFYLIYNFNIVKKIAVYFQ